MKRLAGCLLAALSLFRANAAEDPLALAVRFGAPRQVVDNFGANGAWSCDPIGAEWSEANRERLAELLFSREAGIGLSCWRFNIGAGGAATDELWDKWRGCELFQPVAGGAFDWSRQAGQQWFLRAARRHGVEQLLACVYSPPAWLTRNGHAHADKGLDGCNLKPGGEAEFARFLGEVLQHFAAEGLPLAYLSPANEPAWAWEGGQEGCSYDNEDLKRLVRALHAELARRGLKTEIDIPESGDWPALLDDAEFRAWAHPNDPNAGYRGGLNRLGKGKYREYLKDFLGDPELRRMVGNKLSAHSYWTDKDAYQLQDLRTRVRANADRTSPGARLWQSEYCVMENGRDLGMDTALRVARVIHYDLVAAQVSAWHWWLAISPADYKDGLIYTDFKRTGEQNILPAKTLWVLGNYSRFIRPGFRRVTLEPAADGDLLASAYLDPRSRRVVVVLTNLGTSARTVRLAADRRLRAWTPHLTSAEADLARQPNVRPGAPVTVPARAVVTLVGQA